MKKTRVLVCGASGFIGRNIFESLSRRTDLEVFGTYNTRNFAPGDSRLIQADLTNNNNALKVTQGMDVIIQCAATTSGVKEVCSKPYYHVTDNAVMNSLLFRAAHENRVSRVIFFSCTIMYSASPRPLRETDLDLNSGIYEKYFGPAWTKIYIEKMCEFYARLGPTKFTVLRHSNIYGPHDKFDLDRSHVFGATLTKVLKNNDGKIVVWGDGSEKRDWLYIDDLTAFVGLAMDRANESFDILNVGLGESFSVRQLVEKMIQISGRPLEVVLDRSKPTLPISFALDITKAKNRFCWTPKVSLDEGIQKTMKWYRENL